MSKEVSEEGTAQRRDYVDPPPAPLFDTAELKLWSFYRALIAEFVATLLFLYVTGHKKQTEPCGGVGLLGIAWAFGGMIFILVYCTAGISGGHINPAVTFGLFLARKVSLIRALGYMIAQSLGAICGVGLVKAFMKNPYNSLGGGANSVADRYSNGTALGAEIIGTFVLVYTVFSATDPKRSARDSHVPVLIGCDGVNSLVAKWLGFKKPVLVGRSSVRGYADFKNGHGFKSEFHQFYGNGVRFGFLPCDDHAVYWFFTYKTSTKVEREEVEDAEKIKKFVMNKLGKIPDQARAVIETTVLDSIIQAELRTRPPWDLLWGNISKGNTCIAGDGLHPMTPDIGQGGCSALEDSAVLARCLGEALSSKGGEWESSEFKRIEMALKKYAKERRWRSVELLTTAYLVGFVQQNDGKVMGFVRDHVLAGYLAKVLLKMADFDCGKLVSS